MATELLEAPANAVSDVAREPDVIDVIQWLDQSMNRISALRAKAIDVARRETELLSGSAATSPTARMMDRRAFVSEIAAALTISERAAENLIGVSTALVETLPGTMDALDRGEISYRHAQIMVDHAAGLNADDTTALERAALARGATSTPPRFDRIVRVARECLNPESIEERHVTAVEERSVAVEEDRDGMAWLNAKLTAPHTFAIHDRLTRAALQLRAQGDTRTLAQLRADIFAATLLADGSVDDGVDGGADDGADDGAGSGTAPALENTDEFVRWFRGIRPQVIVTVPALSLLGSSLPGSGDERATLEGYGPIDLGTARILAARAPSFVRILTHPETGAVLSVGRKRYTVPKDLRMWLRVRDGTCRFVGCGNRAERCDIDHTIEWQHGGLTEHLNLAHLCRKHHTEKGAGASARAGASASASASADAWTVVQSPDGSGVLTWTSPRGRTYETRPETEIAPF